ncbi:MAG: hypothetical protein E7406_02620 [Ruminococcaceae bacterium]|nr:hypothetical protein [Oscillospiraceae bacterium]
MTDKHELDINEEIAEETSPETETEVKTEKVTEETVEEVAEETPVEDNEAEGIADEENAEIPAPDEETASKEMTIKEEIISEFAPEPIKIPKYNKEKEKRKAQMAQAKRKKLKSKKARRRRKRIRKALVITRNVLFVLLLVVVVTTTLMSLMVKMNTSEYSVEKAIRKSNPETYVIGKIKNPEKIYLEQSSPNASLMDILRDNSMIPITYAEIEDYVDRSSYPSFISGIAHDVVNYYIYGTPVDKVTKQDIFDVLYENRGVIEVITSGSTGDGYFGQVMCEDIADRISKSSVIKEFSVDNLAKQSAVKTTRFTAVLFSTVVLILLVVSFIVLLVLTVIYCKGYWHRMIGGAIVAAGILAGLAGYFFRIKLHAVSPFVKSMVDAVVTSFNNSAIVFASVTVLVGVLVLLIGKAVSDDEDDEYEVQ